MKTFAFVFFIFSFGFVKAQTAVHYQTETFDAAIFPAESKNLFLPGEKRFTPIKKDVDDAEESLLQQLPELNNDHMNQDDSPVIEKNLKKYRRQYFGYIDNNGKKILFINAFWKKEKEYDNWLQESINVLGGNSFFWNVKFNTETGELFDLTVNGPK